MAVSGFEGFEKRLELNFSGDDPAAGIGLRAIDFFSLERVLHAVQCTVVSAVGNDFFDSYVLSESSLFVYPTRIIIKTCGTTQLLKSVRPMVELAMDIGLTISRCRYTRGSFIFPGAQPYPHTSFKDEVVYLEGSLPVHLVYKKAAVMNSRSGDKWHAFSAWREGRTGATVNALAEDEDMDIIDGYYTMEICMTGLDRAQAGKFFRRLGDGKNGDSAGKEMTEATGISAVNRNALICDYAFDPCGYSMNGLDGDRYSTVHVTPEDGFSYASFECGGSVYDDREEFAESLRRVVKVFRPANLSISITSSAAAWNEVWVEATKAMESVGMRLRSRAADEFPGVGTVVYQTFVARRN